MKSISTTPEDEEPEEAEEDSELPAYPFLQDTQPDVVELAFGDEVSPTLELTQFELCCFSVGSPRPLHSRNPSRGGGLNGYFGGGSHIPS
jgi:hypothetical protein